MRLNRERVPRYLREGRGQVEQISRGVISVEHAWKNNKRDTRSVRSYYEGMKEAQEAAGCRSRGLSNMSNVVLGDDRIHWDKSFSQEAYKLDASRAQLVKRHSNFNEKVRSFEVVVVAVVAVVVRITLPRSPCPPRVSRPPCPPRSLRPPNAPTACRPAKP